MKTSCFNSAVVQSAFSSSVEDIAGERKWRLSHGDHTGDESDFSLAKEGKEADKKEGRKAWLKF